MGSSLGGLVHAWFVWEQGGREDRTGIHLQNNSALNTAASMQGLADQLDSECGPLLVLCQSSNADYRRVEIQDLSASAVTTKQANAEASAGSRSAPAATALSAMTVTKQTDLSGRANRGRMYVGGLAASDVTQEATEWTSTIQGLVQTFANSILSAAPFANYDPVVYHRGSDLATLIASMRANLEVYRQKKRVRT